jgi:hypothetical protein
MHMTVCIVRGCKLRYSDKRSHDTREQKMQYQDGVMVETNAMRQTLLVYDLKGVGTGVGRLHRT